jgi:predicted Zn-dependent protease with MMP-like domain
MKQRFEHYIKRALKELPEEFRYRMENIAISIEPYPTRADMRAVGITDKRHLLGLFRGIPHRSVSSFYSGPVMPSEIVLYQRNIEAICETEDELVNQIRLTLLHEVGHYFGMTEEELRRYT